MHVENSTGLKISYDKTCVYRVGSLRNTDVIIYTLKQLKWSDDDIEMLGITIANAPVQSNKSFDTTIDKMLNVMNLWHNRQLTITGKIILINTLMASLFTYKMYVLPLMSKEQFEKSTGTLIISFGKGNIAKFHSSFQKTKKQEEGLNYLTSRHVIYHSTCSGYKKCT